MKAKTHKGFTKINKVLPGRIKEYKLEKAFYKHQVIKHWEQAAMRYVGDVKDKARAIDLKNGVLVVACLSKELAYQIRLLAKRIMDDINQLVGKTVVFAIYTEV